MQMQPQPHLNFGWRTERDDGIYISRSQSIHWTQRSPLIISTARIGRLVNVSLALGRPFFAFVCMDFLNFSRKRLNMPMLNSTRTVLEFFSSKKVAVKKVVIFLLFLSFWCFCIVGLSYRRICYIYYFMIFAN